MFLKTILATARIRNFLLVRNFSLLSPVAAYVRAAALISSGDVSSMEEARTLLHESSAAGHPSALGRLGRWCLYGLYGEPLDIPRGLSLLQRAAIAGDATASYWLGASLLKLNELIPEAARKVEGVASGCGSNGCSPSSASIPDPFTAESVEEAAGRVAAAKGVMEEIRSMRKLAAREKRASANIRSANLSSPSSSENAISREEILGSWHRENLDPSKLSLSTVRGYAWLYRAARQGSTNAQVALGNLCMSGVAPLIALPQDSQSLSAIERRAAPRVEEALAWYHLAAGVGEEEDDTVGSTRVVFSGGEEEGGEGPSLGPFPHPDALYNLGQIYWEGIAGKVAKDLPRALQLFNTAAAAGDTSALFFLGHLLRIGNEELGIRKNVRKALASLESSASGGHGGAAHYLSQFWREGESGFPPSPARVRYFLELAAEGGFAEALLDLGHSRLTGGDGFDIDLPAALLAFSRAIISANGEEESATLVSAHLAAGSMHYKGLGTPVSFSLALAHYKSAAELNSVEAWENIAAMALAGEGMPVDIPGGRGILAMVERLKKETASEEGRGVAAVPSETFVTTDVGKGGGGCGKSSCACK